MHGKGSRIAPKGSTYILIPLKLEAILAPFPCKSCQHLEQKENIMKKYRMKAPDGTWWETMAESIEKARSNFAFRLRQAGMFITNAYTWTADTEEVKA